MTVLIDSWAWIEYFRGTKAGLVARSYVDGEEPATLSPVNIAEVYRWMLRNASLPETESVRRLMVRRCTLRDFDAALAVEAARLRHVNGWGLGDSIVYATAQATNSRLLTGDEAFRDAEGVEFIKTE